MAKVIESLSVFNSTIRTALALVIVGGLGYGGWIGYSKFTESENVEKAYSETKAKLAQREKELIEKQKKIDSLQVAMLMLKLSRNRGLMRAVDVLTDPVTGEKLTNIEFVELTEKGEPIGKPREFTIRGDEVYIDCWVVKFEDEYIQEATDPSRSAPLCLFRRAFGDNQAPNKGYSLRDPDPLVAAYESGKEVSQLEQHIWSNFWAVANDPKKQKELGITAAHGDAVSIKVVEGKSYQINQRSTGGLSFVPEGDEDFIPTKKPAA